MSSRCSLPLFLTLAATSFAQTPRTVWLRPTGTAKVTRLSNFDTRSLQPPIVDPFSVRPREKENPKVPFLLAPKKSGLPVGTTRAGSGAAAASRFPGIAFTGWLPADPDIAVGKTKLMVAVNQAVAIHDKTGRLLYRQNGKAFFDDGEARPVSGDPKVIYDVSTDRFMIIMMQLDEVARTSHIVLAVSDDGDPQGLWNRYRIETGLELQTFRFFLDYPSIGVAGDDILLSGNMFPIGGGPFLATMFVMIPKAPVLAGEPTQGLKIVDPDSSTTRVAVNGEGRINYAMSVADSATLWLTAFARNSNGDPLIGRTSITVPDMQFPQADIPGPGGTTLDGFDSRLFTLNLKNGRLVTAHNNGSGARSTARWYEVNHRGWPLTATLPVLVQTGDVPIAGMATHMPAIGINALGDVSVLYSATNAETTADLMVSTRRAADPTGTTGVPTILSTSDGIYRGYRWGDYFGIQVDPLDENLFWGYGMLGTTNGVWKTEIASWKIVPDPIVFRILGVSVPAGLGRMVSGALPALTEADGVGVTVASVANKVVGNVATLDYSFRFGTALKPYLRSEVRVLPVSGGRVTLSIFDAVRARYTDIASGPADGSTLSFTLSERTARRAVGSNGNATMRITVSVPGRTSVPTVVDYVKAQPTAG